MGEVSVMVFLDYSLVGAGVGVEGNDRIGENAEFGFGVASSAGVRSQ